MIEMPLEDHLKDLLWEMNNKYPVILEVRKNLYNGIGAFSGLFRINREYAMLHIVGNGTEEQQRENIEKWVFGYLKNRFRDRFGKND